MILATEDDEFVTADMTLVGGSLQWLHWAAVIEIEAPVRMDAWQRWQDRPDAELTQDRGEGLVLAHVRGEHDAPAVVRVVGGHIRTVQDEDSLDHCGWESDALSLILPAASFE